jgi:hypothetical protein
MLTKNICNISKKKLMKKYWQKMCWQTSEKYWWKNVGKLPKNIDEKMLVIFSEKCW